MWKWSDNIYALSHPQVLKLAQIKNYEKVLLVLLTYQGAMMDKSTKNLDTKQCRQRMNYRWLAIAMGFVLGTVLFLMSTVVLVGLSKRQPAEVILNADACDSMPMDLITMFPNGTCKGKVDNFRKEGKLITLSWANQAKLLAEEKMIILPADRLQIAISLPAQPLPLWLMLIFGGSVTLMYALGGITIRLLKTNRKF